MFPLRSLIGGKNCMSDLAIANRLADPRSHVDGLKLRIREIQGHLHRRSIVRVRVVQILNQVVAPCTTPLLTMVWVWVGNQQHRPSMGLFLAWSRSARRFWEIVTNLCLKQSGQCFSAISSPPQPILFPANAQPYWHTFAPLTPRFHAFRCKWPACNFSLMVVFWLRLNFKLKFAVRFFFAEAESEKIWWVMCELWPNRANNSWTLRGSTS